MNILDSLPIYLLILVRISAFMVSAPIFSHHNVPQQVKIGLAVALTVISSVTIEKIPSIVMNGDYVLLILKEAIIGIVIGFFVSMIIYSIQIAGAFIDTQAGFAMASIVDPNTGSNVPLMGHFKYLLGILFFLATNAHHLLIRGILHSFTVIPINKMTFFLSNEIFLFVIIKGFSHMFLSAFMIAIPVVGSLFLVEVALGILARTVPQMNIFVVGTPFKIWASFFTIFLVLPGFFLFLKILFQETFNLMEQLIKILGT